MSSGEDQGGDSWMKYLVMNASSAQSCVKILN